MKKFRWQLTIIFLTGLIVGILLLLERGGGGVVPSTANPTKGGVYTEALVGQFKRLNPLLDRNNQSDMDIDRLIFSGLIRFDSRGLPVADLAESWNVSGDGTIYNVTLKKDLKWHDGHTITTADVAFTVGMMRSGGDVISADVKSFWDAVKVVTLDDTHMQFVLPEAYAPFIDYLSFGLLPEHILGDQSIDQIVNSPFNLNPIGSGPYKVTSIESENNVITGITLDAFKDYAGNAPYISQIVFKYYPDSASAFKAYQDGLVQGVSQITLDVLPAALADPSLSLYTSRLPEISMVLLNLNDEAVKFFQNANIRKALYMGIDRQAIINKVLNGQGIRANGVIFPESWAYLSSLTDIEYDPAQAALILKEEGYVITEEGSTVRKNGDTTLKFVFSYPEDETHKAIAEMIQKGWQALGADVTLEPIPGDLFVSEKLSSRGYQAALVDLNLSSTPDPDPYPFWDRSEIASGQNYSQWDNRVVSDILEQARTTTDLTERTRLYHNFQAIFAQELPSLPLYYPVYNYGINRQVQGATIGPLIDTSYRFDSITSWYLVAKRTTDTTETPPSK
jgi:peptide/nickel transport system substrate-binding protein